MDHETEDEIARKRQAEDREKFMRAANHQQRIQGLPYDPDKVVRVHFLPDYDNKPKCGAVMGFGTSDQNWVSCWDCIWEMEKRSLHPERY